MKYLLISILLTLGSTILSAQDTLHLHKKNEALLVEIKLIKKKTLYYTMEDSKGLKKISLRKVQNIRFSDDTGFQEKQEIFIQKKEEFRSTVMLQSVGVVNKTQAGFNYMQRLSPAITKKASFWIHLGGGYNRERTRRRLTGGSYLEFGTRLELANKRNPQNRLHIGLDVNHQWIRSEKRLVNGSGAQVNSSARGINENRIAIQLPIGFTFRGDNGLYISSGVEISTQKLFPSLGLSIGYAFGQ